MYDDYMLFLDEANFNLSIPLQLPKIYTIFTEF
jgi:hypothetical protein